MGLNPAAKAGASRRRAARRRLHVVRQQPAQPTARHRRDHRCDRVGHRGRPVAEIQDAAHGVVLVMHIEIEAAQSLRLRIETAELRDLRTQPKPPQRGLRYLQRFLSVGPPYAYATQDRTSTAAWNRRRIRPHSGQVRGPRVGTSRTAPGLPQHTAAGSQGSPPRRPIAPPRVPRLRTYRSRLLAQPERPRGPSSLSRAIPGRVPGSRPPALALDERRWSRTSSRHLGAHRHRAR